MQNEHFREWFGDRIKESARRLREKGELEPKIKDEIEEVFGSIDA